MSNFDSFASDYRSALKRGLDATGECPEFFARTRVEIVAARMSGQSVSRILDFGCGTGGSFVPLLSEFPSAVIVGIDASPLSLLEARARFRSDRVVLLPDLSDVTEPVDLIFCNGVFHHIPPTDRRDILRALRGLLTESGRLAFWENNPWNPGTRFVMSRIPFDRDAQTLSILAARKLLTDSGLAPRSIESRFWFPRMLAALRPLETWLRHVPLGGQYWCDCARS